MKITPVSSNDNNNYLVAACNQNKLRQFSFNPGLKWITTSNVTVVSNKPTRLARTNFFFITRFH